MYYMLPFYHVVKVNCLTTQAHTEDHERDANNTSNHVFHSVTYRTGLAVYS